MLNEPPDRHLIYEKISPGAAPETARLFGLFALLVALKTPFILAQLHPHLYYDEGIYLYKARIFFEHLQWVFPDFAEDRLFGLYKPLYSILISPSGFFTDPSVGYRCALFINSLLLSSIVFPVYYISKSRFFPARWLITLLVGCWTFNFAYSLTVMSEALYIPLITWIAFFYMKYIEKPTLSRSLAVGLALAAAVMTKNAGLLLIPALIPMTFLDFDGRLPRLASFSEIARRLPMTAIAVCAWCLWEAMYGASSEQSVSDYARNGVFQIFRSADTLWMYAEIWLRQLAYLNFSTCFLILLLPLSLFGLGTGKREKGLPPLEFFLLLLAFFALLPGTVHMLKIKLSGMAIHRHHMYGRYADMLIPLALIYGAGPVFELDPKKLFSRRCAGRTIAFIAMFVLAVVLSLWVVPKPGAVHIMNTGVAWLDLLVFEKAVLRKRELLLIALLFCSLFFIRFRPFEKRNAAIVLTMSWLLVQGVNMYVIDDAVREALTRNRLHYYDKMSDIRENGGKLYYTDKGELYYPGVYYFHTDFVDIDHAPGINKDKTWVVYQDRIIPFKQYALIRGHKIFFVQGGDSHQYTGYGWGMPETHHRWTSGNEATLHIDVVNPDSDYILNARLFPFVKPGVVDRQRVRVYVDDHKITEWSVVEKREYEVIVPNRYIHDRLDLRFELPDARSPLELGMGGDVRELAIGMISLLVKEKAMYEFGAVIRFGERGDAEHYIGEGWGEPFGEFRWSVGNESTLNLKTNDELSDSVLIAHLFPNTRPGLLDAQRVSVFVNDSETGKWVVDKKGEYKAVIPRDFMDQEIRIRFEFPDASSPIEMGLGVDDRKLAVGMIGLSISRGEGWGAAVMKIRNN